MISECICQTHLDQMIMIEYPGFVKNPDKAIATLRGLETIERVVASQNDRMELRFRVLDPYSHPTYGDREPKKCIVMRIKKHNNKNKNQQQQQSRDEQNCSSYEISIIGRIQTSFKFDSMAEFQWLPMQRTNDSSNSSIDPSKLETGFSIVRTAESLNPEYKSILDDVVPIKDPYDNTLKNFNHDAPLLILPAVFSRFDTPREIHQPHPKFRSQEMREEFERQQSLSIIGRTRKKRSTMSCLFKKYDDPIPLKPPDMLLKERSSLSLHERKLIPRIEECFKFQKVWSKVALCLYLKCTLSDIKFILPLIAYHCVVGPFRTMWVEYAYNPHLDKSSKPLQVLDFRVKNFQENHEYSLRSIHQYALPMRKNPDKKNNKQHIDLRSVLLNSNSGDYMESRLDNSIEDSLFNGPKSGQVITESMCKFRRGLIPGARQLSYQLKDIEIEEVQAIVNSEDNIPTECSLKDGWLPEGSINKIRFIMNNTLNETIHHIMNQLEDTTE